MKYCPQCTQPLVDVEIDDRLRKKCPSKNCGFVHWGNPVPVVAVIVETEQGVVMARNVAWPRDFYSVITGFLEASESPMNCARRETREELGLTVSHIELVGCYPFERQNQVIITYYARAEGEITLNHELDDYRLVARENLEVYPAGPGLGIIDWLKQHGITPAIREFPKS